MNQSGIIIALPKGLSNNKNPYCKEVTKHISVDMEKEVFLYENDEEEEFLFQNSEPKYGLKKSLLLRLADAAGIIFSESNLIKNDTNNVIFQAKAFVRGFDGLYTEFSSTTELNIPLEIEKITNYFSKKALEYKNSPNPQIQEYFSKNSIGTWVHEKVKIQKLIFKSSKIAIAETKAKLRLIRTILDLKSGYTQAELQQGFLVSSIEFKPDLKDEETKKMYMMMGFNNPLYQLVNKKKNKQELSQFPSNKEPSDVIDKEDMID